ncbi:hypothetical protein K474DRAFT_875683 [Panus rudis PR-1116 ss-1]|nr:hypothetical protein K474DRAFT_875683 [Panus rudis PR-1116 ss-1]
MTADAVLLDIAHVAFRLPPTYTACFGTVPYPYTLPYFIQWVPYLTYEIFMFVLAMYKSVLLAREHPETPHLIYVLLRDSLVFYGGTLAMVLVNCLVYPKALFFALFFAFLRSFCVLFRVGAVFRRRGFDSRLGDFVCVWEGPRGSRNRLHPWAGNTLGARGLVGHREAGTNVRGNGKRNTARQGQTRWGRGGKARQK